MLSNFLSFSLILSLLISLSIAKPIATQVEANTPRQNTNELSPSQQFCAYNSVAGSAGLHKIQHKIQNAVLGGSLECTLVKAFGVKMPEGYGYDQKPKGKFQAPAS